MKGLGRALAVALAATLIALAAQAQAPYPNKPIRILVPYAPGGLTDVVARHYADQLRKSLGQNVLVENKPGASGIRAIEEMVHAKPDGYTIMIGNISTNCLTPVLLAKKMRINYDRDVQVIARLADAPVFFISTTTNFSPTTFKEFIDYAKKNEVRYAVGRHRRLSARQYRDFGQARRRASTPAHPVQGWRLRHPEGRRRRRHPRDLVQHHQPGWHDQGRQGAAAGDRGAQRLEAWPDVPTLDELGFKGFRPSQWSAAFAPAGVPKEIIETLHKAFVAAANLPEMKAIFEKGGMVAPEQKSVEDAAGVAQAGNGNLAARHRRRRHQGG